MKKPAALLLMLLCLLLLLCACGTGSVESQDPIPEQTPVNESEAVVLSDLRQSVIDILGISDPLLLETPMLMDLYGIGEDLVRQSASFVTMTGTFPDEVILVEAIDQIAASVIAEKLQNRLDEVMVQSKTYDAENYAAAQKCQVTQNGAFVTLILSPKQADIADLCRSVME